MADITTLLRGARAGDADALAALFAALYPELRRIAKKRLSRDDRGTLLDTTSLVNECYLKLTAAARLQPVDRNHFLAYAASAMRSIVVDFARTRQSQRRGGGLTMVTLDSALREGLPSGEDEVLAVHDALDSLAVLDRRMAQVVEMRYFGGLDDTEIAAALDVGVRTVRRDWEKARLLLAASIQQ